jgi:hypothetical protein
VAATVVVVDGIVLAVEVMVVPDETVVLVSGPALVLVARLDVVVDETGSSSLATRNTTVPTTTTKRPDRIQAVRFWANPPGLGGSDTGGKLPAVEFSEAGHLGPRLGDQTS